MSVEKRIAKKTGKVSWVARVYMGKKKDGSDFYKSQSFSKKSAADEYENNLKSLKSNTLNRAVSDKTLVSVVWEAYIEKKGEKSKDNTIKNYQSRFDKWIEPHIGFFQIGNVNLSTIINFKNQIEDDGASPATVHYTLIVLKDFFEFASSGIQRYIMESPMKFYEMPAQIEKKVSEFVKFLSKSSANAFFEKCQGDFYYDLFTFITNTGIRIAEAAALAPSDFDFDAGFVTVNNNLTVYVAKRREPEMPGAVVLNSCKNHENRAIPLNRAATEAAKRAIERSKGNFLVFTSVFEDKKTLILKRGLKLVTVMASVLNFKTAGDHLARIAEKAKVDNVGLHGLRHTFAANFLMNGGDLYTLSKLLGHKSITSTQIYAHLSNKFLASRMKIVDFGG